jgi:hypothetical protein
MVAYDHFCIKKLIISTEGNPDYHSTWGKHMIFSILKRKEFLCTKLAQNIWFLLHCGKRREDTYMHWCVQAHTNKQTN